MAFSDFMNKVSKQAKETVDKISASDLAKKTDDAINKAGTAVGKAGQDVADSIKNQSSKPKDKPPKK